MTTKKRRGGVRFAGTRLAIVAGSAVAFLAMWVHVARTAAPASPSEPPSAAVVRLAPANGDRETSVVIATVQAAANPQPVAIPARSVSRGS